MAVENLGSLRVPLVLCFRLGRALRYNNEESFFHTYDSIKPIGGANDLTYQSQLSTIKEAARQISDLNSKDYLILSKSTGQLQICDTDDEVTDQLRLYIKKGHLLDDDGNDSGAISDYYENSTLSVSDSTKANDCDADSCSSFHEEENGQESMGADKVFVKDTFHGIDSSSKSQTSASTTDTSDTVEDPLCSFELSEESHDPLCQKSMWHSLMDIDSASKAAGNPRDRNITDKLIKVAELEKSFFSINLDEPIQPPKSLKSVQDVRCPTGSCDLAPHWKSQLHLRNDDGPDEILVKHKQRSMANTTVTPSHISKTSWADPSAVQRNVSSIVYEEEPVISKREKYLKKNTDKVQSGPSSHQQELPKKQLEKEQQPSPLAVHSQNMWSSSKKMRSKLLRRQRNHKHKNTPFHEITESEFNHYEVGQFLLRGWEEAKRELLIYQGKL